MNVSDLITELQTLPPDASVDAMFSDDSGAYSVVGTSTVSLPDGRVIAIVDIEDTYGVSGVPA
jgi:hypothetical protein